MRWLRTSILSQGGYIAITLDNESDRTTLQTPRPQLVQELFAAQARRRPNALAVSALDATLTYAELAHDSDQLAQRLRALGVTRETVVGLCLERSAGSVVGAHGILKDAGADVAEHERVGQPTATGGSLSCQVLAGQTRVARRLQEVYGAPQVSEASVSLTKRQGKSAMDPSPTAPTAARVKSTLARILDIDRPEHTLRDSASLYSAEIRLDSLALVRLLVSLEDEFGIEIGDEDVMEADLDTVASLVRLVESAVVRQSRAGAEADPGGA